MSDLAGPIDIRRCLQCIGIVSTAFIADATPAAFTAHTSDRGQYGPVVDSFLNGATNVSLPAVRDWFCADSSNSTRGSTGRDPMFSSEVEPSNSSLVEPHTEDKTTTSCLRAKATT